MFHYKTIAKMLQHSQNKMQKFVAEHYLNKGPGNMHTTYI